MDELVYDDDFYDRIVEPVLLGLDRSGFANRGHGLGKPMPKQRDKIKRNKTHRAVK